MMNVADTADSGLSGLTSQAIVSGGDPSEWDMSNTNDSFYLILFGGF